MKQSFETPKKVFLVIGLALIGIGVSLIFVGFYVLVIFYSFPGILITYFYYAYYVNLDEEGLIFRNFWIKRKKVKWSSITAVKGTRLKSILVQYDHRKLTILDVFQDRREILDYIIKNVDKTVVSTELMNEWSHFFIIFNEDFKNDN